MREIALAVLLVCSSVSNAAVILYDEAVDGDLIDSQETFTVFAGENIVRGHSGFGDKDRFYLFIPAQMKLDGFSVYSPGCEQPGFEVGKQRHCGSFRRTPGETTMSWFLFAEGGSGGNGPGTVWGPLTTKLLGAESHTEGSFMWEATFRVTSVVPIPAAVWLFGSALVGLGWFKPRQQS